LLPKSPDTRAFVLGAPLAVNPAPFTAAGLATERSRPTRKLSVAGSNAANRNVKPRRMLSPVFNVTGCA
jgi:hypothetical protein